jgi:hypothetical protein
MRITLREALRFLQGLLGFEREFVRLHESIINQMRRSSSPGKWF